MTIEIENLLCLMARSMENAKKAGSGTYLGYDAAYWQGWAVYYESQVMKITKG